MDETSSVSNSRDEKPSLSDKIIKIPTVDNSDEESLPGILQQSISSSEASDEEVLHAASNNDNRPFHLLKRARKKARELEKKGEQELAVKERIRSVAYCRLVYGNGHWQLAKAHGKLGQAYSKRKGFAKQALLHANQGRDILLEGESDEFRSSRMSHSKDVLKVMELIYFVMGEANFQLQNWSKAQQAFKKAEITATESLKYKAGHDTLMYLKIMERLAQVSGRLMKTKSAIEYYDTALKHAMKFYGKNSVDLISLHQGLAKAYKKIDEKMSRDVIEKCIEIAETHYARGSLELADVLYSTCVDMQGIQDYDVSKNQVRLQQCVDVYMDNYGRDHKRTIAAQELLCTDFISNGEHDKAAVIIGNVITSKIIVYGDPSVSLAESYQLLGTIRLSQGKTDKALKHLQKCHSILSLVNGFNHKKTLKVAEVLEMIKKTPVGSRYQSPAEKLKDRPRFNGTVGRSNVLGT